MSGRLTTSNQLNEGRNSSSGRGRGNQGNSGDNDTQASTSQTLVTKFLTGAKGPESFKQVKELLQNEVSIKLGYEMAHIALEEEEMIEPKPTLDDPETTVAMISAETNQVVKEELQDKRKAEIEANKMALAQAMAEHKKKTHALNTAKGKLCGMTQTKVSESVKIKLEEILDYNNFRLNNPARLIKELKQICFNCKGEKYTPAVMAASTRQMSQMVQGFKESTKNHVDQIKARVLTFKNSIKKMLIDKDANCEDKSKDERAKIEDKAFKKLGAFCVVLTSENELHRTFKNGLRSQDVESEDKTNMCPVMHNRAMSMLNKTAKDKRPKHQKSANEKLKSQVKTMRSFLQASDVFRCFTCSKHECKGGSKCPKKGLAKEKWAAHVTMKKMDEASGSFVQIANQDNEEQVSAITQPTTGTWVLMTLHFG